MARVKTVTIRVPAPLRDCCEGASELFLSAPSVRAALDQLERTHPSLHRSVCDETGSVRRHVPVRTSTLSFTSLAPMADAISVGAKTHHSAFSL